MLKDAIYMSHLAEPEALGKRPRHSRLRPLSKQLFDVIFDSAGDAMMVIDDTLRIVAFNCASEKLTGLRKDQALGKRCYQVYCCPHNTSSPELSNQCPLRDRGEFSTSELIHSFPSADGKNVTASVTHTPISWLTRKDGYQLVVVREVHRRKRRQQNDADVIAQLSHELLSPLNLIRGYAATLSNLEETFTAEQRRRYIQAIESTACRLTQLVRGFAALPALESGSLSLSLEVCSLHKLVQRVVTEMHARNIDSVIRLRSSKALPLVRMDTQMIEQVVTNLLDNAIKYSPQGSEIEVAVRKASDKEALTAIQGKQSLVKPPCLIVSVRDSGTGIDQKDLELIFEKYYRGQNGLTHSVQGLGLGLYICRAIVESHGGRIWSRSKIGDGSTFYFSLPVHQPTPKSRRLKSK